MGIADFLFTPGQQRMLTPLFLHPNSDYSLTELLKFYGSGRGAGQHQIEKLVDAGVLVERKMGNQRRLSINKGFSLYPELLAICHKSFGLVERFRNALTDLRHEIDEAFIFGSVARNEDKHTSDVDIMIIGQLQQAEVMDRIVSLENEIGRSIHVNLYEPDEWNVIKRQDLIIRSILDKPTLRIFP